MLSNNVEPHPPDATIKDIQKKTNTFLIGCEAGEIKDMLTHHKNKPTNR